MFCNILKTKQLQPCKLYLCNCLPSASFACAVDFFSFYFLFWFMQPQGSKRVCSCLRCVDQVSRRPGDHESVSAMGNQLN